jgi:signal transduction histidine kinase/ActR/RegA family two-component response regulator
MRRGDGTSFPVELVASVVPFEGKEYRCLNARDITVRRSLEGQLRQSQKMEAIGRLAGGVAHDFNNVLTAVLGFSDLAQAKLGHEDPVRKDLDEIRTAGERAAGLTRQLLAFRRKEIIEMEVLDLAGVVTEVGSMLRRVIGEDIQLLTVLPPMESSVRADRGQLEQVLMNLAVNSRDAMRQGGRITIEVRNIDLDESYVGLHLDVLPGRYVVLSVSDTGTGIDAETKKHIFEPFFTTKEAGRGTGLGLATVYGIVKQSGGSIGVYSEAGHGTTFRIYLPRVEAGVASAREAKLPWNESACLRGHEMVLLLEDDHSVRSMAREVLLSSGYDVREASNGPDALALFGSLHGKVDIVVSDVVMPEMGGREVFQRLRALDPRLKVLFTSGYTDDAVIRKGVLDHDVPFLQKPFTPTALLAKVRDVLDVSRENAA